MEILLAIPHLESSAHMGWLWYTAVGVVGALILVAVAIYLGETE